MQDIKFKSKYSIGDKRLDEMDYEELLHAVDSIWQSKNEAIAKLEAEREIYRNLLKSPLPIHSLWARVAENAWLLTSFSIFAYLLGRS